MANKMTGAAGISDDDMKYRAKDALRDIMRAEEHKGDPELMAAVGKAHAEEQSRLEKAGKCITVQTTSDKRKK